MSLVERSFKETEPDIKLRRDWNKLIALLKGSAILFHRYRPVLKKEDSLGGRIMVVSTLDDLKQVLPLIGSSFKATLTGLSEKEEKVLKALEAKPFQVATAKRNHFVMSIILFHNNTKCILVENSIKADIQVKNL